MNSTEENNQPFYKHPKYILLFIWLILTLAILLLLKFFENSSPTIINILNLFFSGTNLILFYVYGKYSRPNRSLHMNLQDYQKIARYLQGMLAASIILIVYFIIAFLLNSYTYHGFGTISLWQLILYFIAFLFQGFSEELLVRGIIQEMLSKKNIWLALLLPSLLFSLMHLFNDNFNFYAMINTFLIGLIFALMTQITGSLWMAAGTHSIWNFLLGPFFGQYVSGISMPDVLFNITPNTSKLLITGGLYGPEASIVIMLILSLIAIYLPLYYRKREVQL